MSADIQRAAISYFGLPEGTQMVEGGPLGCFAFVIPLTEEHMRGIADRMKALSEPADLMTQPAYYIGADGKEHPIIGFGANTKSKEELRDEYNGMAAKDRARFGSFGQYCAQSAMGMAQDDAIEPEAQGAGGRKVMHVDTPEEEQSALPDTVWVANYDLTREQGAMASDHRKGQCLMQVAMLTEAQRSKYAKDGA